MLPTFEDPQTGDPPRWQHLRELCVTAEEGGFDTVWVSDEFVSNEESWGGARGWWECVSLLAAVAEATSTIGVGTWVLSMLHRNPVLSARVAATLDEVSDGRLTLTLGAGHAADGDGSGYPTDHTVSRYEEALQIMLSLLREGEVEFAGDYHRSEGAQLRPAGPRRGGIPVILGGHGPRTMRIAARYGDGWSGYTQGDSRPEAFGDMLAAIDEACDDVGRDPKTLQRSLGIMVDPSGSGSAEAIGFGAAIGGSTDEIVDTFGRFAEVGVTRLELATWPWPTAHDGLQATIPAVQQFSRRAQAEGKGTR